VEFKDYYKVMGVARDATEPQIKQAYRKLARKYHPDVSKEPDAEARFKEVGEAYEVLRSPEKRAAYDRLGTGPRPGEEFRPPPDFGSGFEFSGADPRGGGAQGADYSDFFESLFGRARAGTHRHSGDRDFDTGRGEDHHAKVMLDLEAALTGGSRSFTLRVPEIDADGWPRAFCPARRSAWPARELALPISRAGKVRRPRAICTSRSSFSRIRCTDSKDAICISICR
jgi:curved DNA-binding protein